MHYSKRDVIAQSNVCNKGVVSSGLTERIYTTTIYTATAPVMSDALRLGRSYLDII